ncbi:MAG: nuclear transport factor 2 family protein [Anaerolineae bacterium]
MTPEQVIERQVICYNARDLDGFIALHSPTAQLFNLATGELICAGEQALRERYRQRFANPNLHAEIINRIVHGNRVIDHERIIGMEPDRAVSVVAIYDVQAEQIQRVWFLFE